MSKLEAALLKKDKEDQKLAKKEVSVLGMFVCALKVRSRRGRSLSLSGRMNKGLQFVCQSIKQCLLCKLY